MKLTKREAVAMQKGLMDILSPLLGNNIFLFEELMEQHKAEGVKKLLDEAGIEIQVVLYNCVAPYNANDDAHMCDLVKEWVVYQNKEERGRVERSLIVES
jgi:hypothetical protein